MAILEQLTAVHEEAHSIVAKMCGYKVLGIKGNTITIDYLGDDNIAKFLYFPDGPIKDLSLPMNKSYIKTIRNSWPNEFRNILLVWVAGKIGEQIFLSDFKSIQPHLDPTDHDHYVVDYWLSNVQLFNVQDIVNDSYAVVFDNIDILSSVARVTSG